MDLLQSLLVPRDDDGLPSRAQLRQSQEARFALLADHTDESVHGMSRHDSTEQFQQQPQPVLPEVQYAESLSMEAYFAQAAADDAKRAEAAQHAVVDAAVTTIEPLPRKAQSQTTKSNKGNAQNGSQTVQTGRVAKAHAAHGRALPIPLGKPRTSDHIIALHQLVNKHGLGLPVYEYTEDGVKGAGTFSVRLRLQLSGLGDAQELILEDEGPFRSKKEAKEVISQEGLNALKKTIEDMGAAKAYEGLKAALDAVNADDVVVMHEQAQRYLPGENPIAKLLEYCNTESLPQPSYQLYQLGVQSFACELSVQMPPSDSTSSVVDNAAFSALAVRLRGGSSTSLPLPGLSHTADFISPDTHTATAATAQGVPVANPYAAAGNQPHIKTFGSTTHAYTSKKAARAAAAALAVLYLREHGHLEESAPKKEKRRRLSMSTYDDDETSPIASLENTSYVSQLHTLRVSLGLPNLEYRLQTVPGTNFVRGWAEFPSFGGTARKENLQGRLVGRVGMLGVGDEVLGKKAAKEEVARLVVGVLLEEIERRRAEGVLLKRA